MIFLIKFLKVMEHIFSAKLNLGIFSYISDHLDLQLVINCSYLSVNIDLGLIAYLLMTCIEM